MARHSEERDVIVVEREDTSLKPIIFGLLLGAALGLLFAPRSGEETRRALSRRLRRMRALAEETVDDLTERISGQVRSAREEWDEMRAGGGGERDRTPAGAGSARQELERRLAEARAKRRGAAAPDDEEPLA